MSDQEVKEWLISTVSDLFMDFLYYARKECENMPLEKLKLLIKNDRIPKELLKEVFNNQIEKEYSDE